MNRMEELKAQMVDALDKYHEEKRTLERLSMCAKEDMADAALLEQIEEQGILLECIRDDIVRLECEIAHEVDHG